MQLQKKAKKGLFLYQVFFVCLFTAKRIRDRSIVSSINPIPTRLCHVIYCCGDKSYPCLVGIGLSHILTINSLLIYVFCTSCVREISGQLRWQSGLND